MKRAAFIILEVSVVLILLAIGIICIISSYDIDYWVQEPIWNPSVLGAGVSIIAVGVAFMIAFIARRESHEERKKSLIREELKYVDSLDGINLGVLTRYIFKQHPEVTIGVVFTILILIILILIQAFYPDILTLDIKWILVAITPILLALVIGGYIKGFKGFGVELELVLKEPVASMSLMATDAITFMLGIDKDKYSVIEGMSDNEKFRVSRLRFYEGRIHYYDEGVICKYIYDLPCVEYLEIAQSDGRFRCLLTISIFKRRGEIIHDELNRFIDALEAGKVHRTYRKEAIIYSVTSDSAVIDVLDYMRDQGIELVAVTSARGYLMGLINKHDIEKLIANEVVSHLKSKRKKQ